MKRKHPSASKRPVSAGVLLYKTDEEHNTIHYLLGLIPQRNFWTVFKGMPEKEETLQETALREFQEETGTKDDVLKSLAPEATLRGSTAKKDLIIFLQEGSHVTEECFDIEQVVKIDEGYMKGKPEIVSIRWLTMSEALEGTTDNGGKKPAKLYPSQLSILEQAESFLTEKKGAEPASP